MHVSKAIDYTEIIKSRCEGGKKKKKKKVLNQNYRTIQLGRSP